MRKMKMDHSHRRNLGLGFWSPGSTLLPSFCCCVNVRFCDCCFFGHTLEAESIINVIFISSQVISQVKAQLRTHIPHICSVSFIQVNVVNYYTSMISIPVTHVHFPHQTSKLWHSRSLNWYFGVLIHHKGIQPHTPKHTHTHTITLLC
jgi:hypothetical protein